MKTFNQPHLRNIERACALAMVEAEDALRYDCQEQLDRMTTLYSWLFATLYCTFEETSFRLWNAVAEGRLDAADMRFWLEGVNHEA